jgi:K+-transporting ATPase ATPase C chain
VRRAGRGLLARAGHTGARERACSPAVPPDAVTASGSGLDPAISPAYAALQVDRVAKARGVPAADVAAPVRRHTRGAALGFLGQATVSVVELNLDLDAQHPYRH